MNVLPGSTNSIGWQLPFVVKTAENNVYGNNAATLYTNRANMIPPLRIPKAVCWQITHWGKRKGLLKNHLTKMTNKITNNTISI